MKKSLWILAALVLILLGLALYFWLPGSGEWPLIPVALALLTLFIHLSRNWKILCAAMVALALFLRFALRGYAYWGYAIAFVACLIFTYHVFPKLLWRIVLVLTCIGLAYFCIVDIPIIRNART